LRNLKTALLILAVLTVGCKTPPAPPEVQASELQDEALRGAGASVYAGRAFEAYIADLRAARRAFDRENLKLGWFRDYGRVREDYLSVLAKGNALLADVKAARVNKQEALRDATAAVRKRLNLLGDITLSITEKGRARQLLAQAEVLLREADVLAGQDRFDEAAKRVAEATDDCRGAEDAVMSFLSRYLDPEQVKLWQRWTTETVAESKAKGITAIVVCKLERRLTVYRNGRVLRTFEVGLGFNGMSNKSYAGDNATPEGRYRVVRKIPSSQYYKALLIDYPNAEDRRRFSQEQSRGTIPKAAAIGGDIEIHGGGCDSLTRGCVSLENKDMDILYGLISPGTPVTIVGTNEADNYVVRAIGRK
jgi:L,D-peptidoglycan transpeptidase YkuD (ErfK/YbiS/YcfS/YnhG family)